MKIDYETSPKTSRYLCLTVDEEGRRKLVEALSKLSCGQKIKLFDEVLEGESFSVIEEVECSDTNEIRHRILDQQKKANRNGVLNGIGCFVSVVVGSAIGVGISHFAFSAIMR